MNSFETILVYIEPHIYVFTTVQSLLPPSPHHHRAFPRRPSLPRGTISLGVAFPLRITHACFRRSRVRIMHPRDYWWFATHWNDTSTHARTARQRAKSGLRHSSAITERGHRHITKQTLVTRGRSQTLSRLLPFFNTCFLSRRVNVCHFAFPMLVSNSTSCAKAKCHRHKNNSRFRSAFSCGSLLQRAEDRSFPSKTSPRRRGLVRQQ